MANVELIIVTNEAQKSMVNDIISKHHSYVNSTKSVGRRIDWLVYDNGDLVGMIGIGSATYPPCKDVLRYLGVSKDEYKGMFNCIANNWKFCLLKSRPNLGTQVLRKMRESAPKAWKEKYGDELKYLVTFVGGGHTGAVYLADNWQQIGYTAGLPQHKSCSMKWDSGDELREKFVKPTGENKKIIFIKPI